MKPEYINILTRDERAASIRMGMLIKMSQHGINPKTVKAADFGMTEPLEFGTKLVLGGALLGGVPLGILAHVIGKQVSKARMKENELKERIRYFDTATGALNQGLSTAQ